MNTYKFDIGSCPAAIPDSNKPDFGESYYETVAFEER